MILIIMVPVSIWDIVFGIPIVITGRIITGDGVILVMAMAMAMVTAPIMAAGG